MSKDTEHIDYDLIAKCLAGEANAEEKAAIDRWLNTSDANRSEYEAMQEMWAMAADDPAPVNVDDAWLRVSERTNEPKVIPIASKEETRSWKWVGWAAAVAILVSVGTAVWFGDREPEMVIVQSGEDWPTVSLPDGSEVTLRENSTLSYPKTFAEGTREVTMTGLGYFDVASDKTHPFIVHTDAGDVRVVGTEFEVDARDAVNKLSVEVAEGIVEVITANLKEKARVTAGQVCTLKTAEAKLVVKEIEQPAAFFWKDRTIRFKRTELSRVIQTLEELLKIKIYLSSEDLSGCEVTATFEDDDTQTIMEVLATTLRLELSQDGHKYTLTGDGC